jgi:putative addiction module component (TIGR02574 family)
MNDHVSPADLKKLTVAERLRLMEDIWSSLCEVPEKVDVPTWHHDELDRRLENREASAAAARPWAEAQAEILSGLRKG